MRQTAGYFFQKMAFFMKMSRVPHCPEKLFSKMTFFKMARERAHEVRTAITINLPLASRSDLFSEYDSC